MHVSEQVSHARLLLHAIWACFDILSAIIWLQSHSPAVVSHVVNVSFQQVSYNLPPSVWHTSSKSELKTSRKYIEIAHSVVLLLSSVRKANSLTFSFLCCEQWPFCSLKLGPISHGEMEGIKRGIHHWQDGFFIKLECSRNKIGASGLVTSHEKGKRAMFSFAKNLNAHNSLLILPLLLCSSNCACVEEQTFGSVV